MTEVARADNDDDPLLSDALDAALDEVAGLRRALDSRAVIEQAKGIIMHRFDVDGDGAFRVLVGLSQRSHVKLHEVARTVVDTRGASLDVAPKS